MLGYAGALSLYGSAVVSTALLAKAQGKGLPPSFPVRDLVVGSLATHKMTRLIAKEGVTTPLRAPFTTFEGTAGSAEVNETPKEGHVRHAAGELLSCPFCLAPWVATAYVAGLALSPRIARAWAATFAVVAGADALQHVYARLRTE
jgi:hypothetical protein